MRSSCFVFPFAGSVKQIACSTFEVAKSLDTIEDLRPSMHANNRHSQAAAAHNCVTGMTVDLFRRMDEARWCGGEINLPRAAVLRRFIPASPSAVILRCSPPLAASLEGWATSGAGGHPSRRRARARLLRMTARMWSAITSEIISGKMSGP